MPPKPTTPIPEVPPENPLLDAEDTDVEAADVVPTPDLVSELPTPPKVGTPKPTTPIPSAKKKAYEVGHSNIRHEGVLYKSGSQILLTAEESRKLSKFIIKIEGQ